MLDFCVKLSQFPWEITDEDINYLLNKDIGYSKEAIWDMGAIVALFSASNRMAHLTGLMPNEEFYEIGRSKKEKE